MSFSLLQNLFAVNNIDTPLSLHETLTSKVVNLIAHCTLSIVHRTNACCIIEDDIESLDASASLCLNVAAETGHVLACVLLERRAALQGIDRSSDACPCNCRHAAHEVTRIVSLVALDREVVGALRSLDQHASACLDCLNLVEVDEAFVLSGSVSLHASRNAQADRAVECSQTESTDGNGQRSDFLYSPRIANIIVEG